MLRRRTTFQEIALATIVIAVVAVLSITYALLNVNADALKPSTEVLAQQDQPFLIARQTFSESLQRTRRRQHNEVGQRPSAPTE